MTGPEHYKEAERLLDESGTNGSVNSRTREWLQERAKVHATLALAAATAAAVATSYDGDETYSRSRGWAGVA